jgi:hypothetical protein
LPLFVDLLISFPRQAFILFLYPSSYHPIYHSCLLTTAVKARLIASPFLHPPISFQYNLHHACSIITTKDDDESEDEEEVGEIRERGTKTTGEDGEDDEDNDTNPNYGGDSMVLDGDGHSLRGRLFHLPDDDIEDGDEGNEDDKGERGQGGGENPSNNKKKTKRRG